VRRLARRSHEGKRIRSIDNIMTKEDCKSKNNRKEKKKK